MLEELKGLSVGEMFFIAWQHLGAPDSDPKDVLVEWTQTAFTDVSAKCWPDGLMLFYC